MSFDRSFRFVLKAEGGYVDSPFDKGGATNHGITQAVFSAWLKSKGKDDKPVRDITDDDVAAIYRHEYWDRVVGNYLPEPLDIVMFDSAVNCGVRQASKWLQRCVKVAPDGVIGGKTLSAVQSLDPHQIAEAVIDARQDFYNDLVEKDPTQGKFLKGWLNRLTALRLEIRNG